MDKVEKATLNFLQILYNTKELPLERGRQLEIEHQVATVLGSVKYRINIAEIPASNEYPEKEK